MLGQLDKYVLTALICITEFQEDRCPGTFHTSLISQVQQKQWPLASARFRQIFYVIKSMEVLWCQLRSCYDQPEASELVCAK